MERAAKRARVTEQPASSLNEQFQSELLSMLDDACLVNVLRFLTPLPDLFNVAAVCRVRRLCRLCAGVVQPLTALSLLHCSAFATWPQTVALRSSSARQAARRRKRTQPGERRT